MDNAIDTADKLNASCIDILKQEGVVDGAFVVVVGAGISIPLMPSGQDLRKAMAIACDIDDDGKTPFWDFFDSIRQKFPQIFRETVIKTLCDAPEWHSEACHQIVALRSASIVTLNYDDHLQDAFARKFGSGWKSRFAIYPPPEKKTFAWPSEFAHSPHLIAVHGYRVKDENAANPDLGATWPDDGIILTKRQYDEHYFGKERGHYLFHWWREVLCRFSCLFIGTTLQEPGISQVISFLLEEKHPDFLKNSRIQLQAARPYRVGSGPDERHAYPEAASPLASVRQVLFDPKQGYRGLLEILSGLSGEPLRGPLESGKQAPSFPGSYSIS